MFFSKISFEGVQKIKLQMFDICLCIFFQIIKYKLISSNCHKILLLVKNMRYDAQATETLVHLAPRHLCKEQMGVSTVSDGIKSCDQKKLLWHPELCMAVMQFTMSFFYWYHIKSWNFKRSNRILIYFHF